MKKLNQHEWIEGTVTHDRIGSGLWKSHYTMVRLDEPLYQRFIIGGEAPVQEVQLMWSPKTGDVRKLEGGRVAFLPSAINMGREKAVDILYRQ